MKQRLYQTEVRYSGTPRCTGECRRATSRRARASSGILECLFPRAATLCRGLQHHQEHAHGGLQELQALAGVRTAWCFWPPTGSRQGSLGNPAVFEHR